MPSGGGTSFGMLVNKAYTEGTANTDGSTNYTGGLYLDVLNSGYTLTAATLTGVTGKYDEIAAYSAKTPADILTGGAGVISINMNSARTGKGTWNIGMLREGKHRYDKNVRRNDDNCYGRARTRGITFNIKKRQVGLSETNGKRYTRSRKSPLWL